MTPRRVGDLIYTWCLSCLLKELRLSISCCHRRRGIVDSPLRQSSAVAIGRSLALVGYVEILPNPPVVLDLADDSARPRVLNPLEAPIVRWRLLPALLEIAITRVPRLVDVALFAILGLQPSRRGVGLIRLTSVTDN